MINNFDKYLMIYDELQYRVNNNILTVEEAEMVNDLAYDKYVIEKKTKEEYGERSFKKKYKFIPDKPGARTGTILVDGKRQRVDFEKSKYMRGKDLYDNEYSIPRQTSAIISDRDAVIGFDRNYFKLKGSNKNQRRDAILHHEVGHSRLHAVNPNSTTLDRSKMSPLAQKKAIDAALNKDPKDIKKGEYSDIKKYLQSDKMKNDIMKNSTKEKRQLRNKGIKDAEKYITHFDDHLNTQEFEADRYSANKTSEKAMKRGLKNHYKLYGRILKDKKSLAKTASQPSNFISDSDFKNAKKAYHKSREQDTIYRNKALKDKELRKNKIYK